MFGQFVIATLRCLFLNKQPQDTNETIRPDYELPTTITFEILDLSGKWYSVRSTQCTDSRYIQSIGEQLQDRYPGLRIRAMIDNRIIDIWD